MSTNKVSYGHRFTGTKNPYQKMLIYICDATDYIGDKNFFLVFRMTAFYIYRIFFPTSPFERWLLTYIFKDLVPTDQVSYGPKCVCTNSSEPRLPLNANSPLWRHRLDSVGDFLTTLHSQWQFLVYYMPWSQLPWQAMDPNVPVIIARSPCCQKILICHCDTTDDIL